jgi:hypothetical protein
MLATRGSFRSASMSGGRRDKRLWRGWASPVRASYSSWTITAASSPPRDKHAQHRSLPFREQVQGAFT